jgi:hypothetical protein
VDEGLDGNMGYIISDGTDEARAGKGENPGEDDALSPASPCRLVSGYCVKPDVVIPSSISPMLSTMRIRPLRILKTSLICILRGLSP